MALSQSELAEVAATLDRRYARLLEEVHEALDESENRQYVELIERMPADIGDQSVGDALADLNLAIFDRHIREMRDIDAARARIRDGTFGTCIDCGVEIGRERLLAAPTATRCVACQEQYEKTFAQPGTPSL